MNLEGAVQFLLQNASDKEGQITREDVEKAFHTKLACLPGGANAGPFAFHEGVVIMPHLQPLGQDDNADEKKEDLEISLDWREPVHGNGATAGPILNINIATPSHPPSLSRAEIQRRHGPLELSEVPRGRSLDEKTSFSRAEPWGRVSFGFTERDPDRLATITLATTKPPF
eukprot:TRINITY_DN13407_c0_g1_i1.p1 TRINITY_DN13407_c0_g1~~TRINITY_DN13407_c0_g1_i1.p1  ORF type:complete len:171 (-),score=26.88 TRINITY_DN13407_c0_g1_i1:51-563(-)